ncbi:MAG: hypothetical protein OXH99_05320 [Bryobacterales bacterium]|nr:hypothetical protein [Bryobacterales bacterium]
MTLRHLVLAAGSALHAGCRLFAVAASANRTFDGLTFRNTDIAIFAGFKNVNGVSGLSARNCPFEDIGFGVRTEYEGSSDSYIDDNALLSRTTSLPTTPSPTPEELVGILVPSRATRSLAPVAFRNLRQ